MKKPTSYFPPGAAADGSTIKNDFFSSSSSSFLKTRRHLLLLLHIARCWLIFISLGWRSPSSVRLVMDDKSEKRRRRIRSAFVYLLLESIISWRYTWCRSSILIRPSSPSGPLIVAAVLLVLFQLYSRSCRVFVVVVWVSVSAATLFLLGPKENLEPHVNLIAEEDLEGTLQSLEDFKAQPLLVGSSRERRTDDDEEKLTTSPVVGDD